jgi:phage terminase large subunit
MTGQFGKRTIRAGAFSVVRQTLPALKSSAYRDFIEILHAYDYYRFIEHRKTDMTFVFGHRYVQFFSADDKNSEKLRGKMHSIVYINEANTVSFEAFNQLAMRCRDFIILDYNPAGYANWIREKIEEERFARGDVKIDVSTYHDNLKFLPQAIVEEIEGLKVSDPDLYEVYAKGNWIRSRHQVFAMVQERASEGVPDYEAYGIDFGYIDPTACVRVRIYGQDLYVKEVFFKERIDNQDIAQLLIENGIYRLFSDHEPRTQAEMKKRYSLRLKPADKGPDSIRQGIGFIRSHRIFIEPDSPNALREFKNYRYELDKFDTVLPDPIDKNNHTIDATRYALSRAIRGARLSLW